MPDCLYCGDSMEPPRKGRTKKFCSDRCRLLHWRTEKRFKKLPKAKRKEMHLKPIGLKEASDFIRLHHSHHIPTIGHKFSIGCILNGFLVGVIVIGRPVARALDDGYTAEITRCCTDRTKNVASMLLGAAYRAAKAMGYERIITYTLESESGVSLKAAGYQKVGKVRGRSWSHDGRPRIDKHPTCNKTRWERR